MPTGVYTVFWSKNHPPPPINKDCFSPVVRPYNTVCTCSSPILPLFPVVEFIGLRGLIEKYVPPPWGGGGSIRQCHFEKKYEKGKIKGGSVKENGRKGKEKGRKGERKEERGKKKRKEEVKG
jgi:hypothetical protein